MPLTITAALFVMMLVAAASLNLKSSCHRRSFRLMSSNSLRNNAKSSSSVWTVRRKMARTVLDAEAKKRASELKNPKVETINEGNNRKANDSAKFIVLTTAFFTAVGLATLRLGGRAAFVQFLGLDFISGSDIQTQISDFLEYFDSMGSLGPAAFFFAWLVAKTLCIDAFTVVLALSSGVLFGGIAQGAAASVLCASTASFFGFLISRFFIRDRARDEITKRPLFRAVDRACAREGFKTVFTLRLSPLLPIPVGGYNYLFGATSVSFRDFALGLTLGSLKPYLLDSYLGVVGKEVIDGQGSKNDLLFAGLFFVILLVGGFATQLAGTTFDEIKQEAAEEQQQKAAGRGAEEGASENSFFLQMLGMSVSDLPSVVRGPVQELVAAADRLRAVIKDEWEAIQFEHINGVAGVADEVIGWDGEYSEIIATMKARHLISATTNATTDAAADSISDTTESTAVISARYWKRENRESYTYPGVRIVKDYECEDLSEENVGRYGYESVMFTFVMINYYFSVLSEDDKKE